MTDDERARRIEPERAEEALVLLARPTPGVDVGLRPARDDDAFRRDLVVADEVVAHRLVLDDVRVAEGRDDALADRVIPARHVRDDRGGRGAGRRRGTEPPRAAARSRGRALHTPPACAGRARAARSGVDRSASSPSPARRAPSAEARCRDPSRASSSDGPAASARRGSRGAGSGAWRAGSSRAAGRARGRCAAARVLRCRPAAGRGRPGTAPSRALAAPSPRPPRGRAGRRRGGRRDVPRDPPRSRPRRTDGSSALSGRSSQTPSAITSPRSVPRSATRASRRRARAHESASAGVPQAGQPSTPNTVTSRPSARRSASPSPPTGEWSSSTRTRSGERVEPRGVEAVEPRHVHDLELDAALGEQLGREQRLVEHDRAVREEDGVRAPREASARTRPRAGPRARSVSATGRSRAESRRSPSARDRPAQQLARLLRAPRLHDRELRQRREQRDVPHRLMRLPRTRRDQARVVEGVDHLRALARLVVDLLVRAGREERRERVHDRQQAVPREAGRGGDHVLLGDSALDEALRVRELEGPDAAVRGEVRVEDDEVLPLRAEADELLAVRVDDVLVRDSAPDAFPRPTRARPRATGYSAPSSEASGSSRSGPRPSAPRPSSSRSAISANARSKASSSGAPACQRYVPPPAAERFGVLHEGDALALDRAGDERLRAVLDVAERGERRAQLLERVAVARHRVPAERAEALLELAERDDLVGRLVGLQLVPVDDDGEARRAASCAAACSPS